MARSKKEPGFWTAVVAEAQASTESLAAVAAKHSVTEAALRYHFYKREKPTEATKKSVPTAAALTDPVRQPRRVECRASMSSPLRHGTATLAYLGVGALHSGTQVVHELPED